MDDFAFPLATFVEWHRDRCLDRINDGEGCGHIAPCFPSLLASGRKNGCVGLEGTQLLISFAGLRMGRTFCRDLPSKGNRSGEQVTFDELVEKPKLQSFGGIDRLARHAHVDGRCDPHQPGKPLRALRSRNDAQVHFRLARLCIGTRHTVVSCHGEFQSAAQCRSVDSHHDRFAAILDLF